MMRICMGSNVGVGPRSVAASTAGMLFADSEALVAAGFVLSQAG